MADDDTNLPADYDLIPVDHTPQFADAPVPKAGQTVPQPNVMGDISSMPGKVASAVGDVTGVSDAYKAATGQMTPEEAQMFALGALPMLAGGPEAKAVGEVASDIAPEVAKGIRAFHGSPYDFNQFDLSKIGTGEGAQAYGHGLYFAENPSTADVYKKTLALKGQAEPQAIKAALGDAVPYDPQTANAIRSVAMSEPDPTRAAFLLQSRVPDLRDEGMSMLDNDAPKRQALSKAIALEQEAIKGHMYEVNINADPEHFLDWDKPLSEQHPKVQEALQSLDHPVTQAWQTNGAWPHATGQNLYDAIGAGRTNAAVSTGKTQAATEQLRDAGIPGIKYLDQGSRANAMVTKLSDAMNAVDYFKGQIADNPTDKRFPAMLTQAEKAYEAAKLENVQRTHNYVVFNDKLIDIVKKYGLAGLVAGGASHFSTVPVDHQPDFPDQNGMADGGVVDDAIDAPTDPTNSIAPLASVPKAGQTVPQPNVMGDISSMPGKVASAVGDVTGVSDAYKAATGQMTPEEAQMFALGALPMLAGGPEAKAVGEVASDIAPEVAKGIRAFHGSPYDFNQFDLSKIGTGEGAQAYGHGLYFAENPTTAKSYRDALATPVAKLDPTKLSDADTISNATGFSPAAIKMAHTELSNLNGDAGRTLELLDGVAANTGYQRAKEAAQVIRSFQPEIDRGHMYEVNINADPEHFLDWDKPLSEQSPKVQQALQNLGDRLGGDSSIKEFFKYTPDTQTGEGLYRSLAGMDTEGRAAAGVTNMLRKEGVPGIKYLDQGSRANAMVTKLSDAMNAVDYFKGQIADNPTDKRFPAMLTQAEKAYEAAKLENVQRTHNYVVFNDKLIDIVKKYGLAGLVAGGASHFSTVPVDHQPDFPDQNGMADGGTVDDATDAPTDPTNSIAPLATALNQAVPNFDPEAAGFRPSTNIEDVRNKPLWRKAIEVITRKPLPGDLTNYAKGGGVKATKTQANYRGGTAKKRCGICSMFQPPRGCSAVRGVISPQALCDFYEPTKAEKKSDVKIDATHDGPWMSCMSIDGATMYRNKNIPATANIKGKTVDVDDMLLHHEVPEREDLEKLIAEFKARFKREPNTKERKGVYLKAHNRSGTPNERAHAKKIGVDWKAWSAWCRGEESKIEKMKFTNQPKDADVKPIPHSHDELEAMDHASAA